MLLPLAGSAPPAPAAFGGPAVRGATAVLPQLKPIGAFGRPEWLQRFRVWAGREPRCGPRSRLTVTPMEPRGQNPGASGVVSWHEPGGPRSMPTQTRGHGCVWPVGPRQSRRKACLPPSGDGRTGLVVAVVWRLRPTPLSHERSAVAREPPQMAPRGAGVRPALPA